MVTSKAGCIKDLLIRPVQAEIAPTPQTLQAKTKSLKRRMVRQRASHSTLREVVIEVHQSITGILWSRGV